MKKTLTIGIVLGSLVLTGTAFADISTTTGTTTSTTTTTGTSTPLSQKEYFEKQREMMKEHRNDERDAIKEQRENLKDFRKDLHEDNKEFRKDIREENKERKDERQASTSLIREQIKNAHEQRNVKAGIERANYAVLRLERQISNLEKLSARVSKHLALRKSKGADTTAAEAKLVQANVAIATAKGNVASLKTSIQSALATWQTATSTATSTTNFNDILKGLKPQILETEKSVRDAHKALNDVMKTRTPHITPLPGTTSTSTSTTPTATTTATTTTSTSTSTTTQ